jgi:hypothetical protein
MVGSLRPFPRKKLLVRGNVRPFKGGTREKVIQTLDIGAGFPILTGQSARKYPDRKSLAVDPVYGKEDRYAYLGGRSSYRVGETLDFIKRVGLNYSSLTAIEAIDNLIKNGTKVRHVNFKMPHPGQNYDLENVFHRLKKVLLPNGKVFMSSEKLPFLEKVASIAKKEGYVVTFGEAVKSMDPEWVMGTVNGQPKVLHPKKTISGYKIPLTITETEYYVGHRAIYNLTLTLSPKTVRKDRKLEEQK